jgi:hypothetical protein
VRSVANVTEVPPAGTQPWRQRATGTTAARGLPDWAIPAAAWALAALMLLLAAAFVPLSLAVRQNPLAAGAAQIVTSAAFAVVGLVVALHRPRNPIGWLMLCVGAVSIMFYVDTGLYNVLNYRLGRHLPLAPAVLALYHVSGPVLGLLPLIILVFADGRLPSPRWRLALTPHTRARAGAARITVTRSSGQRGACSFVDPWWHPRSLRRGQAQAPQRERARNGAGGTPARQRLSARAPSGRAGR